MKECTEISKSSTFLPVHYRSLPTAFDTRPDHAFVHLSATHKPTCERHFISSLGSRTRNWIRLIP
jgi:hypothetical protein